MNYVAFTSTSYGTGRTKREAIKNLMDELEKNNAEPTAFALLNFEHLNFDFGHHSEFSEYKGKSILVLFDRNQNKYIEPNVIIL